MKLLLCFFISFSVYAAEDCARDAQIAKQAGVENLVISFEGLASYGAGFVRKGLLAKLSQEAQREIVSKNYAYTSVAGATKCVNAFKATYPEIKVILIGHSFGGGIAAFDFLTATKLKFKGVITLDPRSWSSDSQYNRTKDIQVFRVPEKNRFDEFYNFYQRGGMGGYQVRGATSNQLLIKTAHTAVPKDPRVKLLLENLVLNR